MNSILVISNSIICPQFCLLDSLSNDLITNLSFLALCSHQKSPLFQLEFLILILPSCPCILATCVVHDPDLDFWSLWSLLSWQGEELAQAVISLPCTQKRFSWHAILQFFWCQFCSDIRSKDERKPKLLWGRIFWGPCLRIFCGFQTLGN